MTNGPKDLEPSSTQVIGAVDTAPETTYVAVGLSGQDLAAIQALPAGTALLIVQHGPNTGARFLLDAPETTVGRHPRADIFLDDVTVSRKHAVFVKVPEGGYAVRECGSLNGTYVNRSRVELAQLNAGDEVQIGKYRMTYHPGPIAPAGDR
ncbi:FHA domain-containing protein [Actinomyces weissii]|uniref:FHA domain-containing protein n=1 Tax=Actinomyces weissii TaxID=675090 RepID=A0A7T7M8V1_9ACTO|nr:FHA domain-containing protein [Actinomyces weissii]QQM66557.1 FHA domain-containing protein [Actinomyces weissii]